MTFLNKELMILDNDRARFLKSKSVWKEGLDTTVAVTACSGMKPKFYWIEAKSYIWIMKVDDKVYSICVSEEFAYKHRLVTQKPSLHFAFNKLILLGKF